MTTGRHRSRTLRRVFVKTPGGRTTMHYRQRKPQKAHCANCHQPLAGVPRLTPIRMKNTAHSKKRPERPYGGVLCSRCLRAHYKAQVRAEP